MSDLILHHYWQSPYAEKVRRMLGFKKLAWKSVILPMMMPKPDLVALTGGYRKTPVLQVGADIWCDSDLIARALDRLHPDPPLLPPGTEALSFLLTPWQQELFWLCVRTCGAVAPVFPPGFLEDRAKMREHPITREQAITDVPVHREMLRAKLELLDTLLADRPFALGAQPSLADFSLFHPVNALKLVPQTRERLDPFVNIGAWMERIEAFGFGEIDEIESADAIEIARRATPRPAGGVDPAEPNGLRAGDRVEIVHEDFGMDPVAGELVASTAQEVALRREDPRAGEIVVHLPREHYRLRKL
jgi:glutathione S-transferase